MIPWAVVAGAAALLALVFLLISSMKAAED